MAKSIVTSAKLAKLASKVLKGYEPTREEIVSLAASVLRQREKEEQLKAAAKAEEVPEPVQVAAVSENEVASDPSNEDRRSFWGNLFGRRQPKA